MNLSAIVAFSSVFLFGSTATAGSRSRIVLRQERELYLQYQYPSTLFKMQASLHLRDLAPATATAKATAATIAATSGICVVPHAPANRITTSFIDSFTSAAAAYFTQPQTQVKKLELDDGVIASPQKPFAFSSPALAIIIPKMSATAALAKDAASTTATSSKPTKGCHLVLDLDDYSNPKSTFNHFEIFKMLGLILILCLSTFFYALAMMKSSSSQKQKQRLNLNPSASAKSELHQINTQVFPKRIYWKSKKKLMHLLVVFPSCFLPTSIAANIDERKELTAILKSRVEPTKVNSKPAQPGSRKVNEKLPTNEDAAEKGRKRLRQLENKKKKKKAKSGKVKINKKEAKSLVTNPDLMTVIEETKEKVILDLFPGVTTILTSEKFVANWDDASFTYNVSNATKVHVRNARKLSSTWLSNVYRKIGELVAENESIFLRQRRLDNPGCDWPYPDHSCALACCAEHDRCFDEYGCTALSMLANLGEAYLAIPGKLVVLLAKELGMPVSSILSGILNEPEQCATKCNAEVFECVVGGIVSNAFGNGCLEETCYDNCREEFFSCTGTCEFWKFSNKTCCGCRKTYEGTKMCPDGECILEDSDCPTPTTTVASTTEGTTTVASTTEGTTTVASTTEGTTTAASTTEGTTTVASTTEGTTTAASTTEGTTTVASTTEGTTTAASTTEGTTTAASTTEGTTTVASTTEGTTTAASTTTEGTTTAASTTEASPTPPPQLPAPPPPGGRTSGVFGDPHLSTFDRLRFDCQGEGEFIASTSLETPTFSIQERYSSFSSSGACPQVTYLTGVAIQDEDVPLIQLSVASIGQDALNTVSGCPINYYVEGEKKTFGAVIGSGAIVENNGSSIKVLHTKTNLSISIRVAGSSPNCFFSNNIFIPYNYRPTETILGLLGTPNGNRQDDWRSRDGSIHPLPTSTNDFYDSTAYQYCVENWCIEDEEESIFTYDEDESFEYFYKCSAAYEENILTPSAEVAAICGTDRECILDGICGNLDSALDALAEKARIDDAQSFNVPDEEPACGGEIYCPSDVCALSKVDPSAMIVCCPSGERTLQYTYASDGWDTSNSRWFCTRQPTGAGCYNDFVCASGICRDKQCKDPNQPVGTDCTHDEVCATGLCRDEKCVAVDQGLESDCGTYDELCLSNACVNQKCAETKIEDGSSCEINNDCISGACAYGSYDPDASFVCCPSGERTLQYTYASDGWDTSNSRWFCTRQPTGAGCNNDFVCASGICRDKQCKDPNQPVGTDCTHDEVCATGLCRDEKCVAVDQGLESDCGTYDELCLSNACVNQKCAETKIEDGSSCEINNDCISGACAFGSYDPDASFVCCPSGERTLQYTHASDGWATNANRWFCTRQPTGAGCYNDFVCASGICRDKQCKDPNQPVGTDCTHDEVCATGLCRDEKCVAVDQGLESDCGTYDELCLSNACVNQKCAETKIEDGSSCEINNDCISGACAFGSYDPDASFVCCPSGERTLQYTYASDGWDTSNSRWFCTRQPTGAGCYNDFVCASGICRDKQCKDPNQPVGTDCTHDEVCATGLCRDEKCVAVDQGLESDCGTYDELCLSNACVNQKCAETKIEDGSSCEINNDCISGACAFGSYDPDASFVCCPSGERTLQYTYASDGWDTSNSRWFCTRQPTGAGCYNDFVCASGICRDKQCKDPNQPVGTDCTHDEVCATGLCRDEKCVAVDQGLESDCGTYDELCLSNACVNQKCAETKIEDGSSCEINNDCISGACAYGSYDPDASFVCCPSGERTLQYTYASDGWATNANRWFCTRQPTGAACYSNSICLSKSCNDNFCDEATGVENDVACSENSDCLSGACGYSSYSPDASNVCCASGKTVGRYVYKTDGWEIETSNAYLYFCTGEGGHGDPCFSNELCASNTCRGNKCWDVDRPSGEECGVGTSDWDEICSSLACREGVCVDLDQPVDTDCKTYDDICSSHSCVKGKCAASKLNDNEACGINNDCLSGACGYSSYSPDASNVCCASGKTVGRYVYKTDGWEIETYNAYLYFCTGEGGHGDPCFSNELCASNTCRGNKCWDVDRPSGEECGVGTSDWDEICSSLACREGVCVDLDQPVDTDCKTYDDICSSHSCVKGKCAASKLNDNEACGINNDCLSGACGYSSYSPDASNVCCASGKTVGRYVYKTDGWEIETYNAYLYFCTGEGGHGDPCFSNELCASNTCRGNKCWDVDRPSGEECGVGTSDWDEICSSLACREGVCVDLDQPVDTDCKTYDDICSSHSCVKGKCAASKLNDNEACGINNDCLSGACGYNSYSPDASNVCCASGKTVGRYVYKTDGWEIETYNAYLYFCTGEGGHGDPCFSNELCASNTCRGNKCWDVDRPFGEECGVGTSDWDEICSSLACREGVCVDLDQPVDTDCKTYDDICSSHSCVKGKCAASKLNDNEACGINNDCLSGACGYSSYSPDASNVCCASGKTVGRYVYKTDGWEIETSNAYLYFCTGEGGHGDPCFSNELCASNTCRGNKCWDVDRPSGEECGVGTSDWDEICSSLACREGVCVDLDQPVDTDCKTYDDICSSHSCMKGKCAASKLNDNEACGINNDCLSGACGYSSYSPDASNVCCASGKTVGRYVYKTDGWEIETYNAYLYFCTNQPAETACFINDMCLSGSCHNGICVECRFDSMCPQNACRGGKCYEGAFQSIGAECGEYDELCESESCVEKFCAESKKDVNDSCTIDNDCSNGACGHLSWSPSDELEKVCCESGESVKLYTDESQGWPTSGFRYFCTGLPAGTACRWYRMCASHNCGEDEICV